MSKVADLVKFNVSISPGVSVGVGVSHGVRLCVARSIAG